MGHSFTARDGREYTAEFFWSGTAWEPLDGRVMRSWPQRLAGFDPDVHESTDEDSGWRVGPTPRDAVFRFVGPGGCRVVLTVDGEYCECRDGCPSGRAHWLDRG